MTTTAPPKTKTCDAAVKNRTGAPAVCGGKFKDGECENRKAHVHKLPTGFCGTGHCEGTNKKSPSGKAMKTCTFWQTCPCKCHIVFDQMFTMSDQVRSAVDSSGYMADTGGYVMPTFIERLALPVSSTSARTNALTVLESPLPDVVPATVARPYAPTPSGRSAPGELESWVKEACDVWLVDGEDKPCTPGYVSNEIGHKYGIKPPSVGAIDAVWKRWATLGFAVIEKKPTRFVSYTPEGIELTLEGMKARAKRGK